MNVLKKNKADIVTGPQFSKSNNLFLKVMERNFKNGSKIKWASTNNVFFKSSTIKNNLKFSSLLNKTGGEDQLFFLNYLKLVRLFTGTPMLQFMNLEIKKEKISCGFSKEI